MQINIGMNLGELLDGNHQKIVIIVCKMQSYCNRKVQRTSMFDNGGKCIMCNPPGGFENSFC